MGEQPQQKKRKWDVPGPATLPQPAPMIFAAGLGSVLGNGVVGTQAASFTPAVDIALAQAAAAALFSKYHPGAQVKQPAASSTAAVAMATAETKPGDLSREVYINDAPTGVRIHLTKRGVQDEIQSRTGTLIVTRGRYYPPGAIPDSSEKPLHLLVKPALQAGSTDEQKQHAVNNAVSDIQRILQGIQPAPRAQPHPPAAAPPSGPHSAPPYGAPPPLGHSHPHPPPQHPTQTAPGYSMPPAPYGPPPPGYPAYQPPAAQPAPPLSGPVGAATRPGAGAAAPATSPGSGTARSAGSGSGSGSCNVYTGIPNPGSFPVADKVRGPGGSFLQHISSTTGATLQMRGHGSGDAEGPDPLHVFVSAPGAKALEDAKSLLLDLLRTVADEFKQANPALAHTVVQPVITQASSTPFTSYGAATAPPPYPLPMYGVAALPAGAPPYYPPPGQSYYPQAGPYPPTHAYGGPPPPYTAPPYPGAPPPDPYPASAAAPGAAPQQVLPYHYPTGTTAPPPYGTAPPARPPSQPPAASAVAPPGYAAPPAPPSAPPAAASTASSAPATRPYGAHAAPASAPSASAYPSSTPASTTAPAAPSLGGTSVNGTAANGVGNNTDAATAGAAPPKRKFREAREGEQARPSPPPSDNPYAQYAQAMGRNQQGNTGSNLANTAANKQASGLANRGSGSMDGDAGSMGGERAASGSEGASAPAPAPEGAAAAAQAPPASSGAQVTGSLQGLIGYYDGDD